MGKTALSEEGQSLIEVTIVLMVVAVVFGALIVAILASLKNAQFAQNQIKATKYAQEALERMRVIRDSDSAVVFAAGSSSLCITNCVVVESRRVCKFSDLWECSLSVDPLLSPCTIKAASDPQVQGCYFNLANNGTELSEPSTVNNIKEDLGSGLFRQIYIKDTGATFGFEKTVIVKVSWTDASGDHESNLETILTDY